MLTITLFWFQSWNSNVAVVKDKGEINEGRTDEESGEDGDADDIEPQDFITGVIIHSQEKRNEARRRWRKISAVGAVTSLNIKNRNLLRSGTFY